MHVLETIDSLRRVRRSLPLDLGLVPTMGYLHEGHLSLVRQAQRENDLVAVSIFVNPTQFGPSEDFARYPRDMARDLGLLDSEGVDLVFAPSVEEMYRAGTSTHVDVSSLSGLLEGARRPGHFRGVATVVAKLFHIVAPQRAYFGQKDAQQVRVIQKMVADLDFDLDVVVGPTLREADGLAMSSRNVYLGPEERQAAVVLWRSLQRAKALYEAGERDAGKVRQEMENLISLEPMAEIDYVSVADADSLQELVGLDRPTLVSLAVRIGRTRLIDNIVLPIGH